MDVYTFRKMIVFIIIQRMWIVKNNEFKSKEITREK